MLIRVRFWMMAGKIARWYADRHARIAADSYGLCAACFNRATQIANEITARLF
jgi:hypothetical protein